MDRQPEQLLRNTYKKTKRGPQQDVQFIDPPKELNLPIDEGINPGGKYATVQVIQTVTPANCEEELLHTDEKGTGIHLSQRIKFQDQR